MTQFVNFKVTKKTIVHIAFYNKKVISGYMFMHKSMHNTITDINQYKNHFKTINLFSLIPLKIDKPFINITLFYI